MIDAHTHLNSPALFPNRKEYILEFEKIGGTGLINVGADDEYNKNSLIISKNYNGNGFVKCTIGFHPYEIVVGNINEINIEKEINKLKDLYLENKGHIMAIGEAGIDTHYDGDINLELQKKLFKMQCDLARELGLPIVIHSRDDFDSTMDVLKEFKDLKIYFHCRGYSPDEIEKLKNYNFKNYWIGFCGNITYPKAINIKKSLLVCNMENILIETDAPYLTPQNLRGKLNFPSNIKYIYDFVAQTMNVDNKQLVNQIKKNFDKLYI